MEQVDEKMFVQYKERLIEVFKAFISFCEEKKLSWYCFGGTLLGAIRHHDIIPWDDDVDVIMPRNDYNRIIEYAEELRERGFDVISIQNTKDGPITAKFIDINTSLWEIKEIPFSYGVYVDLFPLDETEETRDGFTKTFRKFYFLEAFYHLSLMRLSFKDLYKRFLQKDKAFIIKNVAAIFVPHILSGIIRKAILKLDERFSCQKGPHLGCYHSAYWGRDYYEKTWYNSSIEGLFHGFKVNLPIGYHEYLTQVYGDYMQLPPIEKQTTHHYHYFLDLEKHYSIEEIKMRKKEK